MKRYIQILIYIAFSISVSGQNDTIRNDNGTIEVGSVLNGLKEGKWISYYKNGNIEYIGSFYKGKRDGKWIWYHENGQILSKEKYYSDILLKSKFWDSNGDISTIDKFKREAEYPGGMEAFRKMIYDSLVYPKDANELSITGEVRIQFKINVSGEMVDSKILKRVDRSLDYEALRVVNLSGKWIPGVFHNRPYYSIFVIPVIYKLE